MMPSNYYADQICARAKAGHLPGAALANLINAVRQETVKEIEEKLGEQITHPFTGEIVSFEQKRKNGSETIRHYQILTRSSDPVMLRGRMKARGELDETNDPQLRDTPLP